MKGSDIIAEFLRDQRVLHVFGLQGGSVVHIFDSLEQIGIPVTYTVHEQAAALAAVSATRLSGVPCVCVVTTGPAGTNALTGLLAAWQDSIPTVFISGQTRSSQMSYGTNVRQVGSQEFPIIDVVKPMTKYAEVVRTVESLEESLKVAFEIALSGRPGPVWLDIPVDIQWAEFERKSERKNLSAALDFSISQSRIKASSGDLVELVESLKASRLPLIWVGNGVRLAGAENLLIDFLGKWSLPFVTTWGMKDFGLILPDSHLGTIGPFGQRGANMAVFSSDLLVVLGSHLSITQTSQVTAGYASNAKIIVIDIDQNELDQLQVEVSMKINADVGNVLASLVEAAPTNNLNRSEGWDTLGFQKMNGIGDREVRLADAKVGFVNSDLFLSRFFKSIEFQHNVVIDGGGTALYSGFQSELSSLTRRILCSTAMSSMGTGVAEALGAMKVDPKRTIVIIGDGSFWMNAMDLVTAVQQQLPLTVLVINNGGYLAIRHTQESFLGSRFYGTSPNWGLTFPKLENLANALGLHYSRITSLSQIGDLAAELGERVGVSLVEVMTPDDQPNLFKQATLRNEDGRVEALALRDMWPFAGGDGSSLKDAS